MRRRPNRRELAEEQKKVYACKDEMRRIQKLSPLCAAQCKQRVYTNNPKKFMISPQAAPNNSFYTFFYSLVRPQGDAANEAHLDPNLGPVRLAQTPCGS